MKYKKIICFYLTICFLLSVLHIAVTADSLINAGSDYDYLSYQKNPSYNEYLAKFDSSKSGQDSLYIEFGESDNNENSNTNTAYCASGDIIEKQFSVADPGFYEISIEYFPTEDSYSEIEASLLFDGETPFSELESITLEKAWADDGKKQYDIQGNQIFPDSEQRSILMKKTLVDYNGSTGDPFKVFLDAGYHSISFAVIQGEVLINRIGLFGAKEIPDYQTVLSRWESKGYRDAEVSLEKSEAEGFSLKSEISIMQRNDRSSAATTPYHCGLIRYNTIGGSTWATPGQWVEWDIDVKTEGLYNIACRFKQNEKINGVSSRTIYIDGSLPFAEAKSVSFGYDSSWQVFKLGDENGAYKFYFDKGIHTIRMEACLGDYGNILSKASSCMESLNQIYTDFIMVTGSNPDINRDYELDIALPDTIEKMRQITKDLKELELNVKSFNKQGKSGVSVITALISGLESMLKDTDYIPHRLGDFQSNITALGTWINQNRGQNLQLDYLRLLAPSDSIPKSGSGFFGTLKHTVSQFLYSYVMDYANVGNNSSLSENALKIWLGSGRDQAEILRKLANHSFTPETRISANIQLVTAGALLPAFLSGNGPDIYLGMAESEPVNYALRNAVVNLKSFDDYGKVLERFFKEAYVPFELDEGLYALPETFSYSMLFYRKDILKSLGIKQQDLYTWESLLQKVLPELDLHYFDFGMQPTLQNFASMLYQEKGNFYIDNNRSSAFNTPESISAFERMTQLYTDYAIPKAFDFANRFRSGQMPLAICDYTAYNQLSVFAPEIDGLWGMMPLPGVADEDGNIRNTSACIVTGCVILSDSKRQNDAWSFLKWYTSDNTQMQYAKQLEMVMGTGARYASANVYAMESVSWSKSIRNGLESQLSDIKAIPQVAGGYYTNRAFDFAFRRVVYDGMSVRESLVEMDEDITNEIREKRKEFYSE